MGIEDDCHRKDKVKRESNVPCELIIHKVDSDCIFLSG